MHRNALLQMYEEKAEPPSDTGNIFGKRGKGTIYARAYSSGLTEKEATLLPLLTPNCWAEGAEGTHKKGITLL